MRAIDCDVAIVGLGPGGANVAILAAQAGLSVYCFDRKAQAGKPIQCAEFVPSLIDVQDDMIPIAGVQQIDKMLTYVEAESVDIKDEFPGHMIDRAQFDARLVTKAQEKGAICDFGVSVRDVSETGELTLSDGRVFRAKVIVGADGPRSIVGQAIHQTNDDIVETRQVCVPLLKPHTATDIYLSNEIVGGYGWVFPKGNVANVGLGVVSWERLQLKPLLDSLLERVASTGQVGTQILSYTGGAIPVGGMVEPTGSLGDVAVFLVGDAAGLTNPITGAGIASAVISGKMAAEAIISHIQGDEEACAEYKEDLEDLFGVSLRRAVSRRRELMDQVKQVGTISPEQLRISWIAYEQYWRS